jgi:predicted nucleic acid-binding protein
VLVVDASVLVSALADDETDGDWCRSRLSNETLAAPHLVDLEVLSVLRRLVIAQRLPTRRAAQAVVDLVDLPLQRAPHQPLLPRCWELHNNLTSYDAAYVALAEALGCPLLTADVRLSRASGLRCAVEVARAP